MSSLPATLRIGVVNLDLWCRMETMNHSEIVSFIWGVADLIRDVFKRGKYRDIILPLTVLRRLDCTIDTPSISQITSKYINPAQFSFLSLSDQQAVADFLDRETAKIDALIEKIEKAIERFNHRPRKTLGFRTPYEVFFSIKTPLIVALGS